MNGFRLAVGSTATKRRSITKRMRCPKLVTPSKLEANRKNAKRSTGPRTERGKSIARFNAVTLGLFAKHVAIPICDGYKPERDFQSLLDEMHRDFQPVGVYEEWLVVKIAECMWRTRRATRCESGSVRETSVREATWRGGRYDNSQLVQAFASELCVLGEAETQLRESGTLSQKTYREVAQLLEEEKRKRIQSEQDNEPMGTEIYYEQFLTCITDRKEFLDDIYKSLIRIEGERSDEQFDHNCLLPEHDMDKILRYEERMHRQIDWAVKRLLESQERRKTLNLAASPSVLTTDESSKRSQ
jgi:hypothetical protein